MVFRAVASWTGAWLPVVVALGWARPAFAGVTPPAAMPSPAPRLVQGSAPLSASPTPAARAEKLLWDKPTNAYYPPAMRRFFKAIDLLKLRAYLPLDETRMIDGALQALRQAAQLPDDPHFHASATAHSRYDGVIAAFAEARRRRPALTASFLEQAATSGLVNAVGDPATRLVEDASAGNAGIGLGLVADARSLRVHYVSHGGPADTSGILPDDRLLAIDAQRLKPVDMLDAYARLRGRPGTSVALTLQRGHDKPVVRKVTRQWFKPAEYDVDELPHNLGWLRLYTFQQTQTPQLLRYFFRAAATRRGVVIDLRQCAGGSMAAGIAIASELASHGVFCDAVDAHGRHAIRKLRDGEVALPPSVPIVVLVGPHTTSGGELLAAALQKGRPARLVGSRTAGNGTLQTYFELGDGLRLGITTHRCTAAGGAEFNQVGLRPDVEVTGSPDAAVDTAARLLAPEPSN